MSLMKDMFDFTPVSSWVENFNESTHDSANRTRIFESFVMLPEVEESARIILDRIHRKQGRGFFITGLYGSGKTIFMAWLSAILTEPTLRKQLLDTKPEWSLDACSSEILYSQFYSYRRSESDLNEALWASVTDHLRSLSPPVTATLSNTEAYLDHFSYFQRALKVMSRMAPGQAEAWTSINWKVMTLNTENRFWKRPSQPLVSRSMTNEQP